jgi:ATP-dependent Clp protease ATP-binding subunit ClpA
VVKVGLRDGKIALDVEGPATRRLTGKKKPPLLTAE